MTKKIKIPIKAAKAVEEENEFLIAAPEVKKLLDEKAKFSLVDIRTEAEFKMMHIEGALLATRDLVEEIFNKWPKDSQVVLYDHTGAQAMMGAQSLVKKGFSNAKAIAGGIDAWSEAIDPLIPRY